MTRPRLLEKLDAGLASRLTLVAAPAGFGKSTLVSHWLQTRQNSNLSWLSLDEGDSDPVRFFGYLIMALQRVAPNLGDSLNPLLQATPLPPSDVLMTALINDLAAVELTDPQNQCLLILDDYHLINNPSIHEAVTFLVENSPPRFHLLLLSRIDPPLPLSRWRVRRQLTEIRVDDLRFTAAECALLLNEQLGLVLTLEQIEELAGRTEGWAAALQLATISMQDRDDLAEFIASFSGSHHFVLDYLTDEVLDKQPVPRREFFMRTAILERFCAPLCAAVLTNEDGNNAPSENHMQEMLESLEQSNLFITRLDDERHWYRYHHLFAEFLRKRLYDFLPHEECQALYREAAIWCDVQGHDNEAIHYALQSGDETLVLTLAEKYILLSTRQGEMHRALGWLEAIEDAGIELSLLLQIRSAWALLFSSQIEKLMVQLAALESRPSSSKEEARRIAGNLSAIHGWLAIFRGDIDRSAKLTAEALERLPVTDLAARGTSFLNLGNANLLLGKLQGAIEGFTGALTTSQQSGALITESFARTYLTRTLFHQGKLHAAEEGYRRIIDQVNAQRQNYSQVAGVAYWGLSELLLERHQLDEAADSVEHAIELFEQMRNSAMLILTLPTKARIQIALGNVEMARDALQNWDKVTLLMGRTQAPESHHALRTYIDLHSGNKAAAYRWAAAQTPPEQTRLDQPVWRLDSYQSYLALCAIWSVESPNQAKRALALLAQTKETAQHNGFFGIALQALIHQAVAWQTLDDQESALAYLEEALVKAEPAGYLYSFVSIGAPMQRLLSHVSQRDVSAPFVEKLFVAFAPYKPIQSTRVTSLQQPLIEPLSERELEVLALLADGCSNAQIAEKLIITVGTTKRHVSNIFGKLGVGSRTQAIALSRELGLI
ncbi:MAG: LuxR C-terminal-related transcriptional regulator [Chloroflexota bacterium]